MRAGVGGAGRDVEGGGWPGGDWCRRLAQLYVMETKRKAKTDRGDKLHSVDACMCVCMRRPLIKPLVRLLVSVCEPYLCLRVSHLCAGG